MSVLGFCRNVKPLFSHRRMELEMWKEGGEGVVALVLFFSLRAQRVHIE